MPSVFSSIIDSTESHPSLALAPLLVLSLLARRRSREWTPIVTLLATLAPLAASILTADALRLDAAKNAAHALWPAPFAHIVWVSCGHRGGRWIALGYALAAVAVGASYSEAWRAPWLYESALAATRWVAALLVTYAWASERRKDEGPGAEAPSPACAASDRPMLDRLSLRLASRTGHGPFGLRADSGSAAGWRGDHESMRSRDGARKVALILGGGHALGVVGAWAAANPWRDWYLARGLTWAEYAACAVVMVVRILKK